MILRFFLKILPLCIVLSFCARNPHTPHHSIVIPPALLADACKGTGTQLAVTDDEASVDPIKPVSLSALTLSGVKVVAEQAFPPLPFSFLTLTASVNDSLGGFTRFTIQSMTDSKEVLTQDVPSGILRWVPGLMEGPYKIGAVPCNSLGCRSDANQTNLYQQQANNFPALQDVKDSMDECFGMLQTLYDSGNVIVQQAQSVSESLKTQSGLHLADGTISASCLQDVVRKGVTSMDNIAKLGPAYEGELNSNPDAMHPLYVTVGNQTQSVNPSSTSTDSTTETNSSDPSSMKSMFLVLGIGSIVAGAITMGATQVMGWSNLRGGRQLAYGEIVGKLKSYSYSQALDVVPKLNLLPADAAALKEAIEGRQREFTASASMEADAIEKLNSSESVKSLTSTPKTKIGSGVIAGFVLLGAGLVATLASRFMLAGTDTTSSAQSSNPLDNAAFYMTDTLIPLQTRFRQCTLNLAQKISAASAK